jgi:hypothetical protein
MELNLNGLPNNAIHVLCFSSEVRGNVKLYAVSQVDAVFSHGGFVWMFKTDVSLMLLQPRVHGTASLPNVDLVALIGDSVYTRCP